LKYSTVQDFANSGAAKRGVTSGSITVLCAGLGGASTHFAVI